jgi:hypothetical protein
MGRAVEEAVCFGVGQAGNSIDKALSQVCYQAFNPKAGLAKSGY